ncbi:unnamed protein product [Vicia faba]|uniref:Uncharacterized protein n=1 Tax=Vicia faba TaxID=3906 RepID=A0AAV1B652_VICFA|nr:unnamed protein product [Vicia faba]
MDQFLEEIEEPVSPHGQYFNSSVICSYIFGFLELAIPFDVSLAIPLIKDVFIPINPRFSSIMDLYLFHTLLISANTHNLHTKFQLLFYLQQVRHEDGKMIWKKVEVKPEEHVKIPKFPETKNSSPIELYDSHLSDHVASILTERTLEDKPL